jgi:hypothetical protein
MRYEPGFALIRVHKGTPDQHPHPHLHPNNPNSDPEIEDKETASEDEATLKSLKLISLFSIFFAGVASTALTLLAVMDTFRYTFAHHIFLRMCFAGLALQSAGRQLCTRMRYCMLSRISHISGDGCMTPVSRVRITATITGDEVSGAVYACVYCTLPFPSYIY